MASFIKGKLKSAREALGKKNYEAAKDASQQILDYEPENYNANVFLGLALLELGDLENSEQAYRKAINTNPGQILAWQGISKLYERTKAGENYVDSLEHLLKLFAQNNDSVKCAETVQKLIEFRRQHGSRLQITEALALLLPTSPLYPTLSTLPPPDATNPLSTTTFSTQVAIHDSLPIVQEIIALTEMEEEELVRKEVDKRRMRLGASGPEQLKKEVGREVWGISKLPTLYDEILNHPNTSDDLRRATESKLMKHKQSYLYALPMSPEKSKVANELDALVNGAVILGIPDELAWMIFLEGKDCDSIEGYDFNSLRQFIALFPFLPLTSLLREYLKYVGMPLSSEEDEERDEEVDGEQAGDDPFDVITDAFSSTTESILAHRILADVYLREVDYENAIKAAESGLELVSRAETNIGRNLKLTQKAFNIILATSLVHLFPPKHHPRAIPILDEILAGDPDNIHSLMSRAYVLQHTGNWEEAGKLFARVAKLRPDDVGDGLRAREEHAWCLCQGNDLESGVKGLKRVLDEIEDLEGRDVDKARCLWRLGKCFWRMGDDKREEAYRYFITSLKRNPTYAPAFTSLGIYYLECSSPPDPTRASKCFQKAFELDAREADASRRLAEGFAEERKWDLVEVVAKRTIEGEGGLDAGIKGGEGVSSGRYLPTNAWAWKAVGVVELNRRNYPPAIQAFQIALRADTDDQLSWLRLGEAYSKAGRHAAALKALGRAHELNPDDWICMYFIGEVQRQTGDFEQAIDSFEAILNHRPSEVGVLMSLGQTHLDQGRVELSTGFIARAEQSFVSCIRVALKSIKESPGFRVAAWKTAADAIFSLSNQASYLDQDSVFSTLSDVSALVARHASERLSGIVSLSPLDSSVPINGLKALEIAAAAYDYRITLGSSEPVGNGSAWFDLGVALHSRAASSSSTEAQEMTVKQANKCILRALREDPGNQEYWNALGNVHFTTQPKIAQHAFIKALEFGSKNVVTWTNLGFLYLHHNDLELANEALYRAQVLDPDYTMAWVGQGLVATANGHDREARSLFEHAVSLTADVPEADLEFASRVFLQSKSPSSSFSLDSLFPAFFFLDRYCKRRPDDASALHLFALICERLGHVELGVELIRRAISILETTYEETEDPIVERQFTIANSNLARLLLSQQQYEGAIESFQSAIGLLPEADEEEEDPTTRILRTQAQFGSGLATFKMGDLNGALELFQEALESAGNELALRGQVIVMLAKTLWAIGTEEGRESAKAQLLACIANDPENLAAINALAGMGILTEDDGLVDAALSEILSLPLDKRNELDPGRDVNYLLTQHYLGQSDSKKALSIAQKAVFTEPSLSSARQQVATLSLQQGEPTSALAVLSSQEEGNLEDERKSLGLRAVAETMNKGEQATRLTQRAIMLTPWETKNWEVLAYVRGAQ